MGTPDQHEKFLCYNGLDIDRQLRTELFYRTMAKSYFQTQTELEPYLEKLYHPEDSILQEIRYRCEKEGLPAIQVGALDGHLLTTLVLAIGAKKIVEIGTLGGYSGVFLARGLPENGKLYTFEYNFKHANVAKESFEKAGLGSKTEIFVGPALENLSKIENYGPFDCVFIDADKKGYVRYLDWAANNLRKGGVVLADNTFAWGMVHHEKIEDPQDEPSVKALQEFNSRLAKDMRFKSTILPTGEGLSFAVKVSS